MTKQTAIQRAQGPLGAIAQVGMALSPWVPGAKPSAIEHLDLGTLSAAIAPGSGARLTRLESVGGHSGTTDRKIAELHWSGDAAGLPSRVFVKSTPPSAKNRTMVAALNMAVNEVEFYNRARSALSETIAPTVHFAHAGNGARHLIVMEDLVGAGGEAFRLADDCDLDHASGVIRALAAVHAAFWQSPRFAGDLGFVVRQFQRPGFGLLMRQFTKVRTTITGGDYELPDAVHRMVAAVNPNAKRLYQRWEQGPLTLIHGDSHLGNTFRRADGESGLLDWQVVQQAPGMREVAYFLGHSVPIELRRAHEEELIRLYLSTLSEHGVTEAPDFDAAWRDYRFFMFDAWDSVAITAVWEGLQDPDNVAASNARANAAVEDLRVDEAVADYLR